MPVKRRRTSGVVPPLDERRPVHTQVDALKPTSSSLLFGQEGESYTHLYSCVVTKRMGSPL